jgi:hypothetical protein
MNPDIDEVTWVTHHRLDVPDPDGAMTDRARMALMDHISAETERPRRRLPWLAGATAVAAVAAVAVALFAGGSGAGSSTRNGASVSPGAGATRNPAAVSPGAGAALAGKPSFVLLHLAHSVAQTPALPGNATLVEQSSNIVNSGQAPSSLTGYDLYEDNGDYYFGQTLTALRSTVSDPSASDSLSAPLGQVVAAAAASANSTPSQAAEKLLAADPHPTPQVGQGTPPLTQAEADRDLEGIEWQAISSALEGGAGQPQVRAGALLAAAALPNTKVTNTTDAGQPVVKVTDIQGPDGDEESLTVNGQTGILLNQYSNGGSGGSVSNTTYQVSRVTAPGLDPAH